MPDRITLSRTKGWRMPENTVKVDRSTRWGNPWTITDERDAAEAVRLFRAAVLGFHSNGSFCPPFAHPDSYIGRIIADAPRLLRGKNMVAALDGSLDAASRARLTAAVAQLCETIGAEIPTPEGKGWFDDE